MSSARIRRLNWICVGPAFTVAVVAVLRTARGQDAAATVEAAAQRAGRFKEMDEIIGSIRIAALDERGMEKPAVMSDGPLLRWTDPTRDFSDGAFWVWRVSGRPVAVVGIELYAAWSLEFVSLSTRRLKADAHGNRWTPESGGVDFKEIPDAPVPASDEAGRLRQMRELAKQFNAREFWVGNGQHYALRLLPRPVDRYSDAASGVVDGSLFVYAHGTNPEVVLMLEARRNDVGPPKWSFAAAPLTHAETELRIANGEVWKSLSKDPPNVPISTDPYYDFLTPRRGIQGPRPSTPRRVRP